MDEKLKTLKEAAAMKALKAEERRKVFELRMKEAKSRCERELDQGTYSGDIELISLRPPVAPVKRLRIRSKTAEERTTFLLLEEKPEVGKKITYKHKLFGTFWGSPGPPGAPGGPRKTQGKPECYKLLPPRPGGPPQPPKVHVYRL